jgi:DNA primase
MENNDLASVIRSKTDIVDIIGERIPLVARGKNYFGVCPFHDDTNPSLCVSRDKQIYTCFSCHATGNVFTFLMNYDHLDFKETLKYLGDRVGVDVSNIHLNKKSSKYDNLYDAYNLSVKYYQNNLASSNGKLARDYLNKRGITDNLIKDFRIGLSLSTSDDLTTLLSKKSYDISILNTIGLSSSNHDVYNDRIMFPLDDPEGRTVGFSGRIYKDSDDSKYVNTKESPIFKKGEMLYNYHQAIEEARKSKAIIVMEGFMDVIRAYSIGVRNVVALMGTALTSEQINLLKRLSNNIIFCLDGDGPGVHAMLNIGEELLKVGIEIKIINLPDPEDPDSYILKYGKDRFLGLVENTINFSDFKINKLKENIDFNNSEDKAKYINAVLLETTKINDEIRREIILKNLAKEYDIEYNTLEKRFTGLLDNNKVVNNKTFTTALNKAPKMSKYDKASYQILYFMFNNDWVISEVEKARLVFPTEEMRILSSEIIYYYAKYGEINIADFYTYIKDKEELMILLNNILGTKLKEETTKEELDEYFKVIRDYSKEEEIKRLTNKMKKEVDPLEQAKIANKIRQLLIGDK